MSAGFPIVWTVRLFVIVVVCELHVRFLVASHFHVVDRELVLVTELKSTLLCDTGLRTSAL